MSEQTRETNGATVEQPREAWPIIEREPEREPEIPPDLAVPFHLGEARVQSRPCCHKPRGCTPKPKPQRR